ncbi:MAG: aminoglycoside phosphotransferase family protein [Anaerolineales bacterium]|nr:aminoglycoside phosphotransferase family protein [Anaerolineales bacterium]
MSKFDASTYLDSIREAYPQLAIKSARLHDFTEGQFNSILFVKEAGATETIVFRFPRVESALKDLPDEVHLLSGLQGHTTLPIPNPIFVGPQMATMGKAFMGYRMLLGKPLWEETVQAISDDAKLDHLAWQLATFLRELHGLDTQTIGLKLEIDEPRRSWSTLYADFKTEIFAYMRKDACEWVTHNFDVFLNDQSNFDYKPALTHTDFGGSNILFDESRYTITGVIDWAGSKLCDPAVDVAAILNMGEAFFARMLETYPAMQAMVKRTHFFRSTYILQEALNALRDGDMPLFASAIVIYQ